MLKVIRPDGSPLLVARDTLLKYGVKVPVVTDEWWLDVVEASNRQEKEEKFNLKEKREWGRWTFPLPSSGRRGKDRGNHLAWTAMQMEWEQKVADLKITQITQPEVVHSFIDSMPGLKEMCYEHPILFAEYAPQLTVKGNSGDFDFVFDELLLKPIERWYRAGETTTAGFPLCIEQIALRHESFGDYNPAKISENFIQGGMFSGFFSEIDYLVWLILPDSSWLSKRVREFLIDGIALRGHWKDSLHGGILELPKHTPLSDFKCYGETFRNALVKAKDFKSFKFTPKVIESLKELIEYSMRVIGSTTPLNKAFDRFIEHGVIEKHFEHKAIRRELGYNYGLRRRPLYLP